MAAGTVELPAGFVLDQPSAAPQAASAPAGLPPGFVLDSAPQSAPVQRAEIPQGATHITVNQPSITDAVTDIPHEISGAFNEGIANVKGLANRGEQGPISGLLTTGKAVMGAGQMALSPITGAVRSLIGHPMAQAEHAVGTLINPEIAAQDDPRRMYETAKGDVDLAMSALGSRGAPSVPAGAPTPIRVAPSIDQLKAAASAGYNSPEVASVTVKSPAISNFSQRAQIALNDAGVDENLAPKTFGILGKLQKVPDNAVVTGQNIQSIRRMFANAAKSPDLTERLAASRAIESLDGFLPSLSQADVISGDIGAASKTLDTARANYSAAKHAETIDNKTIQAELRAAASNSGMNVANTVRQRMADILIKPELQRGFTQPELDAMQQIVRGSRTQNTMRAASNVLGGGGGLGSVAAGFAGSVAAGPMGALAPLAGYAMKSLSNKLTLRQAEKLSEMIRARSPLASSMQKFEEAASNISAGRNPKAVAGFVLAARNFSTNLRSAGLNVSPSDLLNGLLQAPAAGNADQQQSVPRPPGQ